MALLVGARIGVCIELSQLVPYIAGVSVLLLCYEEVLEASLIRRRYDCVKARCLQFGIEHADDCHLSLRIEVASFLTAKRVPVGRDRLVERFERLEVDVVLVLVVLAHIEQIVAECLVILRLQVVLARVFMAGGTSAVGHPVGRRVGESLKHGVGSFLLYLQQQRALALVGVPVVGS